MNATPLPSAPPIPAPGVLCVRVTWAEFSELLPPARSHEPWSAYRARLLELLPPYLAPFELDQVAAELEGGRTIRLVPSKVTTPRLYSEAS